MFVCFFVFLFVCLFVCLLVCLLFARLFVCLCYLFTCLESKIFLTESRTREPN